MATATLKAIEGPAYKSEDWYKLRIYDPDRKDRPVVFGASEAAVACGVSPYETPLELYLRKRGELPARQWTDQQQEAMRFGTLLEGVIVREYEQAHQCAVQRDLPFYYHPKFGFIGATPDGLADSDSGQWLVEAKNSNWRMFDASGEDQHKFGAAGTDQVPVSYLFQAHQQMAVMDLDRTDFPVLQNGNRLMVYRVDREEAIVENIISAEKELAERIVNGDPPEPNYAHSGTRALLRSMYGIESGKKIDLRPEAKEAWLKRETLLASIKEMQDDADALTNVILHAIGDAEIAESGGVKIKRIIVRDSHWTAEELAELQPGGLKRKGHVRLMRVRK